MFQTHNLNSTSYSFFIHKCIFELANSGFVSIIGLKLDHLHQSKVSHLFWWTPGPMHSVFLLWQNMEKSSHPSGPCHFKVTLQVCLRWSVHAAFCHDSDALWAISSRSKVEQQVHHHRETNKKQRFSWLTKQPGYIASAAVMFKHFSSFASAPHNHTKPDNGIWY